MANDRCWLVCKVCGERTLLAKHMLHDWYPSATGAVAQLLHGEIPVVDRSQEHTAGQRMEEFIEEHGQLLHGYEERKDDRQPFAIEYEASLPGLRQALAEARAQRDRLDHQAEQLEQVAAWWQSKADEAHQQAERLKGALRELYESTLAWCRPNPGPITRVDAAWDRAKALLALGLEEEGR